LTKVFIRNYFLRLPNGKLIQVRKQTAPPSLSGSAGPPGRGPPRGPQFTIRQANATTTQRMFRPQVPQPRNVLRAATQPTQRFTFTDGRVMATPVAPQPQSTPVTATVTSTVFTQQNGSISVARAPQPNTPFGTAKTGNFHA
jgi:hypothetical protein